MLKRSFEIRATDEEKREVSGIAVPYNESFDLGNGKFERFAPGSVDTTSHVKLFRDHEEIIGVVTEMNESDIGLEIRAKISETNLGNETLSLVKDGAIRSFSVGFIPLENETDGNTIIRTKVDLKEVSLVPFPAYNKAEVVSVRENNKETTSMENTTQDYSADIAAVRNHAEELERRLEVLTSDKTATSPIANFRSFGDYVKAVAAGTDSGLAAHRAFGDTNSILTDTVMTNAFVSDAIRILDKGRPTYNVCSSGVLPPSGMNIEFPKITTDTTQVTEQAAVGDTLAFGKINLETATAPVKTYGGYTGMAKQVIDRSSVAYVDAAFRSLIAQYAKATNAAVIAKITAEQNNFNQTSLASFSTTDILDALADSASEINDNSGRGIDVLLVGKTVFKELANAVDGSNRPLLANVGATQNTFGSINPVGLSGSILGIPVVFDPALNVNAMFAMNRAAITTFESAGAPFRLTDEDVVELSNKLSVYGYLACASIEPLAATRFGGVVGY